MFDSGSRLRHGAFAAVLALSTALAGPAFAQKAKDTLRVAFTDPISTVEAYFDPKTETAVTQTAIFSTLLFFDPTTREFKPDLAVSWSRPDPKIIEFKLRRGVKFHDGSDFTAADVVTTINWLADPNTKLRFGANWSFIDHAEAVDDYTVRIFKKDPVSTDLVQLATNTIILPAKIFSALKDKSEFGRKTPIGTGPYKLVSLDSSKGIVLTKNDAYVSPGPWRPAASIGRVEILPVPDQQTQIAQLQTGGVDLIHDVPKDLAEQISADPRMAITVAPGLNFHYMLMDAAGRSGNEALKKQAVRKALSQAIDRALLAKTVVPGGDKAKAIDALCVPVQIGCGGGVTPAPAYDLAAAKKALADAGLSGGFDVSIISNPGSEQMAEAIGGELRKVGVRSSLEKLTFGAYRERQTGGKIQILVGSWSSGGLPDVSGTMTFYFDQGPRDYSRDPELKKLADEALYEPDTAKRDALYAKVFTIDNEKNYVLPLTTLPTLFAHSSEVEVEPISVNAQALELCLVHWKK